MALDFSRFRCLTFDCYGTLIDWEQGILAALRPILQAHGEARSDAELLRAYADLEAHLEGGPYRSYRAVLEDIVRGIGEQFGFNPSAEEVRSLPESLPKWDPFPDTRAALQALHTKYQLAIISNTDDDLFAATARKLGVKFDFVITAQQAKSYKPSLNNFRLAIDRIGLPVESILHVGQSVFHDVVPAKSLGLATVWVTRRRVKEGIAATLPASGQPDMEVPDLKTLAGAAGVSDPAMQPL
jgi:2-haloacid dehalogenase